MKRSLALAALVSCTVQLEIPEEAVLTCARPEDCPAPLVCARDVGFCRSPESACVEADGDGHRAAVDGNRCALDGEPLGVCSRGECVTSECGDGIADAEDG